MAKVQSVGKGTSSDDCQNLVKLLEGSPLKNTKLKLSRSKSAKRRAVKL